MNFSKSQQVLDPQQPQTQSQATRNLQWPTSLPSEELASLNQITLVQCTTIYILLKGTISHLQPSLSTTVHLAIPHYPIDTAAIHAAQTFYAQNSFAISITILPLFTTCTISNILKSSSLITRLAILCGPRTNPGGGNAELATVLSMPNLRSLRLIFQDYEFKGLGPYRWLRPSIRVIMELKTNPIWT